MRKPDDIGRHIRAAILEPPPDLTPEEAEAWARIVEAIAGPAFGPLSLLDTARAVGLSRVACKAEETRAIEKLRAGLLAAGWASLDS